MLVLISVSRGQDHQRPFPWLQGHLCQGPWEGSLPSKAPMSPIPQLWMGFWLLPRGPQYHFRNKAKGLTHRTNETWSKTIREKGLCTFKVYHWLFLSPAVQPIETVPNNLHID